MLVDGDLFGCFEVVGHVIVVGEVWCCIFDNNTYFNRECTHASFLIETTKKRKIAATANIFDCESCGVFPVEFAGISL